MSTTAQILCARIGLCGVASTLGPTLEEHSGADLVNWAAVTTPPHDDGTNKAIFAPVTNPQTLYRLRER